MLCALAASHGDLNATAQSPMPAPAPWVSLGPDGRLKYRADAQGNRIPDFNMVGYGTGIVPLPDLPVKMTLEPAAGDQTARIQAALDTLAKLPPGPGGFRDALLLRRGEYPVSGTVFIRASNPLFPALRSSPTAVQEPPAKSKFLAVKFLAVPAGTVFPQSRISNFKSPFPNPPHPRPAQTIRPRHAPLVA